MSREREGGVLNLLCGMGMDLVWNNFIQLHTANSIKVDINNSQWQMCNMHERKKMMVII